MGPALIVAAISVLLALYPSSVVSPKQAALLAVGVTAGVVLYHAAFGFTSAWRVFISDRRGAGLRAQMLMLAVACAVFFPVLSAGEVFGRRKAASNLKKHGVSFPEAATAFDDERGAYEEGLEPRLSPPARSRRRSRR